jgi:hypothetical protein
VTTGQQPPRQETVRTAQHLTDALRGLSDRLDEVKTGSEERDAYLRKYGHRNRLYIAVDIVITIVTTVAVIISAHAFDAASKAADSASQLRTSSISACQQANVARAENAQLWDYVIRLGGQSPPRPGQTRAQQLKGLARFRAYVHHVFAPRDCRRIYSGKP